jgi:hypothetical protein
MFWHSASTKTLDNGPECFTYEVLFFYSVFPIGSLTPNYCEINA